MFEKILERLEELKECDLCDGMLCMDCEEKYGGDGCGTRQQSLAIDECKAIVQEVAKEYVAGNNDLTVVSALPSLYPLQSFEEEAIHKVVESAKDGGWIPFTQREMTEDEKECCGTEEGYMLDCPLPEEDEEILVTYSNGTVDVDIFMRDGNECYLDSGNDLVTEAIAWRKKPTPYQKGE